MHPSLLEELAADRRERLLADASNWRLAAAAASPRRWPWRRSGFAREVFLDMMSGIAQPPVPASLGAPVPSVKRPASQSGCGDLPRVGPRPVPAPR
jgi:hypothetical protein